MKSYAPMQHTPDIDGTTSAKRYLDLNDVEDNGRVAYKRVRLQPQDMLVGSSPSSMAHQSYTINSNLPLEMTETASQSQFEDQMDTGSDGTPSSVQNDTISGIFYPDPCDSSSACLEATSAAIGQSEPDTCFGVILAEAVSSFRASDGMTQVPVILEAGDTRVKLSSRDTKQYAGIINNATIAKILRQFTVNIDARLVIPTAVGKASSKKPFQSILLPVNRTIRIVIYGLATDQNTIGDILGDAGFYFQHPSSLEYDSSMQYSNPHYLLRPGSQMPALEGVSETECGKKVESNLLDESSKGQLLRLFDEAGDSNFKTSIEPSSRLRSVLKEHQISALVWLIGIEAGGIRDGFPSLWEPLSGSGPSKGYQHKITRNREANPEFAPGGVLADEMGLGKSLSILALICSSLDIKEAQKAESGERHPKRSWTTLIVTPKSTIQSWQQQCESHIYSEKIKFAIYLGSGRRKLQNEFQHSDVVLTTYETMRRDWAEKGPLFTEQWYRVVLDEAHHIRSRNSQTFKAACDIQAWYRWCLTGTPIHNSIDDFAALLRFVRVPHFMNKNVFDFWITTPIKEKHSHGMRRLGLLIKGTCLRRTKKLIEASYPLPNRREQITLVELPSEDRDLYSFFEKEAAKIASGAYRYKTGYPVSDDGKNNNILKLINFLRLICDHGEQLLPRAAVEAWKTAGDKLIDWGNIQGLQAACYMCGLKIDNSQAQPAMGLDVSSPQALCQACHTSSEGNALENESTNSLSSIFIPNGREGPYYTIDIRSVRPSAKLKALIDNIHQEQFPSGQYTSNQPTKSVVFSSWTRMIDLAQQCLEANRFVCARIDGQSSLEGRAKAIKRFNSDPTCTVMLATIGSAGEGVDFTAANNVHLLEPHWNPMVEAQAVDRVHRIGQSREVLITRYVTKDTIETYVQWVQREKLRLIQQSLDSQDIPQLDIADQRWKELRTCLRCDHSY